MMYDPKIIGEYINTTNFVMSVNYAGGYEGNSEYQWLKVRDARDHTATPAPDFCAAEREWALVEEDAARCVPGVPGQRRRRELLPAL